VPILVSRPLFIEEYGLRLLLQEEGVGIEISRTAYENGNWNATVQEAWERGKERKWEKRKREGKSGTGNGSKVTIADGVVGWVKEWWGKQASEAFEVPSTKI
jgi:hypothetical protein